MSEIITARDSEIIATEINTIKEDTREIVIANAIRIGGKLIEAKNMVPYGEWGKWLQEKVEYSQSTANDLMNMYRDWEQNKGSLFDNWTDSETYAKLSYSAHKALMKLPFEDRREFAERVDAENMSTRELERAVRDELAAAQKERDAAMEELDEVRCGKSAAEQRVEDLQEELAEAHRQEHAQQEAAQLARDEVNRLNTELEKARKQADRKEKEAEKARKQLESAQKAEKSAQEQLEQLKANPKIPAAMMQQLQLEAEQEAARKATVDLRKQLDAAVAGKTAAENKSKELEAKVAAMEKSSKLADPEIAKFLALCEQLQEDHNRIKELYTKTKLTDETKAGSMKKAALALIEELRKGWA